MVTGHAIHFDWEIFNVSHPGYVVLIISGLGIDIYNHRYNIRTGISNACVPQCFLHDGREYIRVSG